LGRSVDSVFQPRDAMLFVQSLFRSPKHHGAGGAAVWRLYVRLPRFF
jgi:hypothetical protein